LAVILGDPLAVFAVGLVGDLLSDRAVGEVAVAQPIESVPDVAEDRIGIVGLHADHHRALQKAVPGHEGQDRVVELAKGHAPFLQDGTESMLAVVQEPLVILPCREEALARSMILEVSERVEIVQPLEGALGVRQDLALPARGEETDAEGPRRGLRQHMVDGDQAVQVDVARMDGDAHHQVRDDLNLDEAEILHGEHRRVIIGIEIADLAQEFLASFGQPTALGRNQKRLVLHQLGHAYLPDIGRVSL